jgi:hypothetical protein
MKTPVIDRVRFILPENTEYQFPALSVVEAWVNCFKNKMDVNDVSMGKAEWKLEYELVIPAEDLEFFYSAGMARLSPTHLKQVDAVIDFSDKAIERFMGSNKHVLQICVMLAGLPVNAAPYPKLRSVKPLASNYRWGRANPATASLIAATPDLQPWGVGDLTKLDDHYLTGVIGEAGRGTALAAAMGLGVVEIVPSGRPRLWLSKYTSPLYRVVEEGASMSHVERAMRSVEKAISTKEKDK